MVSTLVPLWACVVACGMGFLVGVAVGLLAWTYSTDDAMGPPYECILMKEPADG